ncbi:hypothetical protein F5Y18DRAFT_433038 [Xylariaceae sp. FL1019]|nr:hypothetical protein F5Y18DRAFT_433038 [Xylariaceae sp. FL1019]
MVQVAPIKTGLKRSKYIPKHLETELCRNTLFTENTSDEDVPQIIVSNSHSECTGQYYRLRNGGIQFIFHHKEQCDCWIPGEPKHPLLQLPKALDGFRLNLIRGRDVPYRMESRFAALMVLKLFLNMDVPADLTPRLDSKVNVPETIAEEEDKAGEPEEVVG